MNLARAIDLDTIRTNYDLIPSQVNGKLKEKISAADYVLNDFSDEENESLEKITNSIIDSISILIDKKLDLFSSTVNNN